MSETIDFALLHGGGQGSWVWDETIAALRDLAGDELGKILALDVPGCGSKRERDTTELDNDDIARELIADIESAGLRDVVLVGHSQAGQVLPLMAALRPELFRQLIHVSCSIPREGQNVQQMMGRSRQGNNDDEVGFPFDPATESAAERYPLMFCNDMDAGQQRDFLGKLGRDSWPMKSYAFSDWRYDRFGAVPASYVLCLRDNILPMRWQQRFAERLCCEHVIAIDAGHQVMNTRPSELASILLREAGAHATNE